VGRGLRAGGGGWWAGRLGRRGGPWRGGRPGRGGAGARAWRRGARAWRRGGPGQGGRPGRGGAGARAGGPGRAPRHPEPARTGSCPGGVRCSQVPQSGTCSHRIPPPPRDVRGGSGAWRVAKATPIRQSRRHLRVCGAEASDSDAYAPRARVIVDVWRRGVGFPTPSAPGARVIGEWRVGVGFRRLRATRLGDPRCVAQRRRRGAGRPAQPPDRRWRRRSARALRPAGRSAQPSASPSRQPPSARPASKPPKRYPPDGPRRDPAGLPRPPGPRGRIHRQGRGSRPGPRRPRRRRPVQPLEPRAAGGACRGGA
jgi:hypothetical protein